MGTPDLSRDDSNALLPRACVWTIEQWLSWNNIYNIYTYMPVQTVGRVLFGEGIRGFCAKLVHTSQRVVSAAF